MNRHVERYIEYFTGKIIHLSFPYETVYNLDDRIEIMEKVLEFFDLPVSTEEELQVINDFTLEQNYPNPFNPSTTIKYNIPGAGREYNSVIQNVNLTIYDLLGREVSTLVNKLQSPGRYEVVFNVSERGLDLSSGTYIYVLRYGEFVQSKKMLLIK